MNVTANKDRNSTFPFPIMPRALDLPTLLPWALAFSLVAVFVVLGNSLVIICFIKKKALRTHTNYFIVSLSAADLFVGVISAPWWIVLMFVNYHSEGWFKLLHNVWLVFDILGGVGSILHLIALSWDRLCAIVWPLNHRMYSSRRYLFSVFLVWGISITVGVLSVVGKYEPLAYNVTVIALFFFLPLIIICITQSVIVYFTRKKLFNQGTLQTKLRKDIKVAKTIGIMIAIFVIGWLPFFALSLVSYTSTSSDIPWHAVFAVKLLQYGNSAANPALYAHKFPHFRKAYATILCSCFPVQKLVRPLRSFSSRISRSTMTSSIHASFYGSVYKGCGTRDLEKHNHNPVIPHLDHLQGLRTASKLQCNNIKKTKLEEIEAITAKAPSSHASPVMSEAPLDDDAVFLCGSPTPMAEKAVNVLDTSDEKSTLFVDVHLQTHSS